MSLPTMEETVDELTEEQAKFILKASVIAGHLPVFWLEKGIELAKMVKHN